ncbi:MAG: phosphoadenylyl-sulfate reductase [Candidatus Abyssobacteria bacterium SURF_17]|uniref:Adenosine 5'-phosphosulfate reductase n=1 Tax=Candidatus Abyssobacteria bacterium SURF_17 TaxID=2093361 RepID=A0A419ETQ0_9BACT|nr:MAG: phosphoadenylyl-sulfate reductase [Candidatus Abyssubacteria bacterium SURF_17]
MKAVEVVEDNQWLVENLNFAEKIDRSLRLIRQAHERFNARLVVANSLGKDSVTVWHLAKRVSPHIPGFIVTTRFKPPETVEFMEQEVKRYPELRIFSSDEPVSEDLCRTAPDRCCEILKVRPTRQAIEEMNVACWVTGLRCTEGRTRTDFREIEERDHGLIKLNPILLWKEREVWQYLAIHRVPVNPLYEKGYRSLGCAPCTRIATGPNERAGRWAGTSKCGGECGIHTRPLRSAVLAEATIIGTQRGEMNE